MGLIFQSGPPYKLSAISCNNLCAIGIDDFMDIGNNILDRKRRKKERGYANHDILTFSEQNAFLSHKQSSCCDIDAQHQENRNQSIHPSIHPNWCWFTGGQFYHNHIMGCPMKWNKTMESTLQYLQKGMQLKNSFTKYYSPMKQGVCHTVALPFTLKKKDLKAKEELWKLKYFTMQKST